MGPGARNRAAIEWKKSSGQVDGEKAAAVHHLHGDGDIEDFHDEIDHDEAETNDDSLEVLLSAMQDLDAPDGANTSGTSGCFDEEDAREILAAMVREHAQKKTFTAVNAAKKMKSLARGFGAGARKGKGHGKGVSLDGSYRISIESLKRRTRCAHCHEVGHWHRECPKKTSSSTTRPTPENAVHYMEAGSHEAMFIGYQDFLKIKQAALYEGDDGQAAGAKDPAMSHQQYMPRVPRVHEAMFVEQVAVASHLRNMDEDLCATVDTGCQRTAVGSSTLGRMLAKQRKGLEAVIKPETHHFKSINGTTSTKHVACVPSSLGPRGCILRPAVFDEGDTKGAPFLLSLPFLLHLSGSCSRA